MKSMTWEIWANVPDQDHIRTWAKIGTCETLEEYKKVRDEYIEWWKPGGNAIRLKQPGSFELRETKQ